VREVVAARALFAAGALFTMAACNREGPRARCHKMLDRYATLLTAEGVPGQAVGHVSERDTAALRAALTSEEGLQKCEAELDDARYTCAMAAPTADAYERCLEAR
jgi:hypothetical protein